MIQEQAFQDTGCPSFNMLGISEHLHKLGYPEKALWKFNHCGESAHQYVLVSCGCGTRPIELFHRCDKSFCPTCSIKRRTRLKRRLLPYLRYYPNNHLYNWSFLTLSPKNYDSYEEGKVHIKESFKRFLKRKYIKERIKGGFWVIEVTNKGRSWHFHIHAIIYTRRLDNSYRGFCTHCKQNYLKWDRFTQKFYCANRKCNHLYEGIIDNSKLNREFLASSGRECMVDITPAYSQKRVLNYMLKYVTVQKDSFTDINDLAYHITKSYHDRQINSFGTFYDFKKQIGENHLLRKEVFCPCCNEVLKFNFDLEISELLSKNKPPVSSTRTYVQKIKNQYKIYNSYQLR